MRATNMKGASSGFGHWRRPLIVPSVAVRALVALKSVSASRHLRQNVLRKSGRCSRQLPLRRMQTRLGSAVRILALQTIASHVLGARASSTARATEVARPDRKLKQICHSSCGTCRNRLRQRARDIATALNTWPCLVTTSAAVEMSSVDLASRRKGRAVTRAHTAPIRSLAATALGSRPSSA